MDDALVRELILRDRGDRSLQMQLEIEMEGLEDGGGGPGTDPLAEALLFLFGWGQLTLPNLQWLADCAVHSGRRHPDLLKLPSGTTASTLEICGEIY